MNFVMVTTDQSGAAPGRTAQRGAAPLLARGQFTPRDIFTKMKHAAGGRAAGAAVVRMGKGAGA
jgi:hypothetical protein